MPNKIIRQIALFGLTLLLGQVPALSQVSKDYFVLFFGENISLKAPVGHAFIGIGKGVPLTCDIDGNETEMVGFYPQVRTDGAKSWWFGPVDGAIKSDVKSQFDDYVFKKIEFADYIKIQSKIADWQTKQYEVTRQDCISFFIDVASLFPDIILPDRNTYTTPSDYVTNFIFINKLLQ
jgi:hypothetical protein